jgi:hypothetical protein
MDNYDLVCNKAQLPGYQRGRSWRVALRIIFAAARLLIRWMEVFWGH